MDSNNLEAKVLELEKRVQTLEAKTGTAAPAHETWTQTAQVAPIATKPEEPKHSESTELWLGRQGLSFFGTALLVLGLAFLLVYSIQYLGAWGRDLLGLGTALVLFGLSRYLESRTKAFSQFLFAGSAALSYFTVYAMHFFDVSRVINSQTLDLSLLLIVGIGATWYALSQYKNETGTVLAYALIYLTFFVGDLSLFSFWALLLATIGIAGLAAWKQWPGALLAGVILTYGTYLFWGTALGGTAVLFGSSSQLTFDILFLTLYFLLFSLPILRLDEQLTQSPLAVFALNSAGYVVLMSIALSGSAEHSVAYLLFALAIYHYLYALLAQISNKSKLQLVAITLGSIALTGAIPLYWTNVSIAWAWLLVGAAQLLLSLTLKLPTLRWTGLLGLTLAALHFFLIDLGDEQTIAATTLTVRLVLGLVFAAVTLGVGSIVAWKEGLQQNTGLRLYLNALGIGLLVALAGVELTTTYITLVWGLIGVTALMLGIALKDQQLRNPAFAVILFVIARAVFVDLAQAETIVRVISFIVLGVVLLGASWVYHRYVTSDTPTR